MRRLASALGTKEFAPVRNEPKAIVPLTRLPVTDVLVSVTIWRIARAERTISAPLGVSVGGAVGYTISQVHEGLLVATETGMTDFAWDDFDPIALMTSSPQYLVVGSSENYSNFKEFLTFARANPGEITMGVTLADVPHLHAAMIEQAYGLEFRCVGYEGTGQRIRALVGGNLDAAIGDISSSQQFVDNGDLAFLAVVSTRRLEATPDVPTFTELGQDLELSVTRGIVMPKGASQEVRNTLETALSEPAINPAYVEQTNNAGADVDFRGQVTRVSACTVRGVGPDEAKEAGEIARLLSYTAILLASFGLFFAATDIPISRFEKLGSGAFPQIVFAVIAFVAAIAIIDALRKIPGQAYGRFAAETGGCAVATSCP